MESISALTFNRKRDYLFVVNLGSGKRIGDSRGFFVKHSWDARSETALYATTIITKNKKKNPLRWHPVRVTAAHIKTLKFNAQVAVTIKKLDVGTVMAYSNSDC